MKNLSTIFLIAIAIFISSCNSETKNEEVSEPTKEVVSEEKVETKTVEDGNYVVSNKESNVKWTGKGVGHGHNGNVNVVAGKFSIADGKIAKGKITIDINSVTCTDLTDAKKNGDLIKHFKSVDFFDVANFPTASLEIVDGTDLNNVKAKMTIKDKTEEISFPATLTVENGNTVLTTSFKIDRTKFGITYKSKNFFENLGNRMIYDDIFFDVKLVAKK